MNYIKLNEEYIRKVRELEVDHSRRNDKAFADRFNKIVEANDKMNEQKKLVRELRQKANAIEANIVAYIDSETIKANQELHEAIIKNKQRYFEELNKVCREVWKEKIKVHNKSVESLKQDKHSEEDHSDNRLYCDLSELRDMFIRKERQCKLCNKEEIPYNQRFVTNKYYNTKTCEDSDYYWDSWL